MEHTLQDVGTVPVDVSSMLVQSCPLVQFAVSATVILARSRNHCSETLDVGLTNATQNAWPVEIVSQLILDSCLPGPSIHNNTSNMSILIITSLRLELHLIPPFQIWVKLI